MLPLRLGWNVQATVRAVLLAALLGGGLFAIWVAALDKVYGLGLFSDPRHAPWAPLAILGGSVTALLSLLIIWMRQPRGGRLTLDSWGVTEWDGDGVKTAIPLASLQAKLDVVKMRTRGLQGAVAGAVLSQGDLPQGGRGATIGGHLILSDADGRRIDVCQGVHNLTLTDRLCTIDRLGPLTEALGERPTSTAPTLPRSENLMAFGLMAGIVGYVGSGLALAGLANRAGNEAVLAATAAALLVWLRSLPWWSRARRLSRPDRGARKVEIKGGVGTKIELADGRKIELPKHPDAAIATRLGEAFLVEGKVMRLETAGARAARRARARSERLTAALRTLFAGAILVPAGPQLVGLVRDRTAGNEGVTIVWRTQSPEGAGYALDAPRGRAFVNDGEPRIIDLETGALVQTLSMGGRCSLGAGALSPDGKGAVLSCDSKVAHSWSLDPLQKLSNLEGKLDVQALAFTREGNPILGDYSGELFVYDPSSARLLFEPPHAESVDAIVPSPVGQQIAVLTTYANSSKLWLWTPGAGFERRSSPSPHGEALAWSPDGQLLAVGEYGRVMLYDLKGERAGELRGGAEAVAFSPDGKTLAAASRGSVTFFDVATKQSRGTALVRWRKNLVFFEDTSPRAVGFATNESLYFLGKYVGVVLRIKVP